MTDMEAPLKVHGMETCYIGRPISNHSVDKHVFGFSAEFTDLESLNFYLYHKLHIEMVSKICMNYLR